MRRNGIVSLIVTIVLSLGGLAATLVSGNRPLLGLDLQGGVSVVLQPVGEASDEALDQALTIIRQRVDGLGVAEPEISRQGDAIVVQLPGIDDRNRAIELVGQTAELRFRPVLNQQETGIPADLLEQATTTTDAADDASSTTSTPDATTTTVAADPDPESDDGVAGVVGFPAQDDATTTTAPADDVTTTTAPPDDATTTTTSMPDLDPAEQMAAFDQLFGAITPAADDKASAQVVLPEYDGDGNEVFRYTLAAVPGAEDPDDPATLPLTGEILSTARAELYGAGQWAVTVEAKGGAAGIDRFNQIAVQCFQTQPTCPTGQLAITLDGRVISAPTIQVANFERDAIQITGSFTERDAKDLALALRYGSLPVVLETQSVQAVSATLGQDALDAGIIAGLVGLAVVFMYMIIYYRLLGLVAMLSLSAAGCLLWTVVSYLGDSQGLALTLAGVTGIIVSVGMAVDSNVVFYERLKEDVSRGRSLRSAVEGAFTSAFSTIVKAGIPSLIGAAVLYWLTVGPVRGFALFLGLSTLFDLIVSYFFMRPATFLLVRSKRLQSKPRWFGMPKALATGSTIVGEGSSS